MKIGKTSEVNQLTSMNNLCHDANIFLVEYSDHLLQMDHFEQMSRLITELQATTNHHKPAA
jgi:hypothetical protein